MSTKPERYRIYWTWNAIHNAILYEGLIMSAITDVCEFDTHIVVQIKYNWYPL